MTPKTPEQQASKHSNAAALHLSTVLVGLLLAAGIALAGTLLAGTLQETGSELVVTQVFAQEKTQLTGAQNKLLRRKAIGLLRRYAFALADATIRFDTVPKLDSKLFLKIATALPEDAEVTDIAFLQHDMKLTCCAENEQSLLLFRQRLEKSGAFERVEGTLEAANGTATAQLSCTPKMEEGRLALAETAA